jgi:hypothetical protein
MKFSAFKSAMMARTSEGKQNNFELILFLFYTHIHQCIGCICASRIIIFRGTTARYRITRSLILRPREQVSQDGNYGQSHGREALG